MNRTFLVFATVSITATAFSGCSAPAKSGCESDTQCRDGRVCIEGSCQTPGFNVQNNGATNNGATNNGVANNGVANNGVSNNGVANNGIISNNEALCRDVCDRLFGSCVEQRCDINAAEQGLLQLLTDQCLYEGFEGDPGCIEALEIEPGLAREFEQFLATTTCDSPEIEEFQCNELDFDEACGCDPLRFSEVGNACASDRECTGALPGVCVQEVEGQVYPDGYCVSFGCASGPEPMPDPMCGEGNFCVENEDVGGLCVAGCRESSDCRDGYQCRLVGAINLQPTRICIPECANDAQCNDGERCADGTCQIPCSAGGPNEPGGEQICNALGFECAPDDAGVEWCVMP